MTVRTERLHIETDTGKKWPVVGRHETGPIIEISDGVNRQFQEKNVRMYFVGDPEGREFA